MPPGGAGQPGRALQLSLFSTLFGAAGYYERLLVAPLVYRFQRCDESRGDIAVWMRYRRHRLTPCGIGSHPARGPAPPGVIPGMFMMEALVYNELWLRADGSAPSAAEVAMMQLSPWVRGSSVRMKEDWAIWTQYDLFYDAPPRQVSNSSTPLLVLNGELDGARPPFPRSRRCRSCTSATLLLSSSPCRS